MASTMRPFTSPTSILSQRAMTSASGGPKLWRAILPTKARSREASSNKSRAREIGFDVGHYGSLRDERSALERSNESGRLPPLKVKIFAKEGKENGWWWWWQDARQKKGLVAISTLEKYKNSQLVEKFFEREEKWKKS